MGWFRHTPQVSDTFLSLLVQLEQQLKTFSNSFPEQQVLTVLGGDFDQFGPQANLGKGISSPLPLNSLYIQDCCQSMGNFNAIKARTPVFFVGTPTLEGLPIPKIPMLEDYRRLTAHYGDRIRQMVACCARHHTIPLLFNGGHNLNQDFIEGLWTARLQHLRVDQVLLESLLTAALDIPSFCGPDLAEEDIATSKSLTSIVSLERLLPDARLRLTASILKSQFKTLVSHPRLSKDIKALLEGTSITEIQLDLHADCRGLEGRHSGNHNTYLIERNIVGEAHFLGLASEKNNPQIHDFLTRHHDRIHCYPIETMETSVCIERVLDTVITSVNQSKKPVVFTICGDTLAGFPSSAGSNVTGIALPELKHMVYRFAKETSLIGLNLLEGNKALAQEHHQSEHYRWALHPADIGRLESDIVARMFSALSL